MKMSPEFIEAQKNMKPGVISSVGFLGDDERDLAQIIQEDELLMSRFQLDFDEVAKWMERIMDEAAKGLGEPMIIEGKWEVQIYEARGFIPCPFKDGIFRKRVVSVRNLQNDAKISFSDLSIHLLKRHHFLQGRGSPFRIEPEQLKKLLD
ncbi:hypothetical protein ACSFC1_05150 [Pseudothermotoga sp. U03pept]|uniref:hypothetical protein n=1 Tax=Pseudothermotoga sp. U03pept TaxID=3447012 RepID=UPI003F03762A